MLKLWFLILCWVLVIVLVIYGCLMVLFGFIFSLCIMLDIWLEVKICISVFFIDR